MKLPGALQRPALSDPLIAAGAYLLLVFGLFGGVLFSAGPEILGGAAGDLPQQYLPWRAFGFGEIAKGNFPLWNPHIFSGAPYFTGFQSALLYPPNWLCAVLPLPLAINWGIALHLVLSGIFMRQWAAWRGLSGPASFLCGAMFMFGGTQFPHIFAGHLSNLCAMPWVPLLLLAIDGWRRDQRPGYCLLGMGAVAMQILAGNPQYVFYTGVAAGLYCLLTVRGTLRIRLFPCLGGLTGMVLGGLGLAAAQLLPSILGGGEFLRGGGVKREFAAMFSFPAENVATMLAPQYFGDLGGGNYWGRAYLWEMTLFFSLTGLLLACAALALPNRKERGTPVLCTMAGLLFILALGSHTHLFDLLYNFVPGFALFRGWSKFTFPMMLFVVLLAGSGFDALLAVDRRTVRRVGFWAGGMATALLLGASLVLLAEHNSTWVNCLKEIQATRESYLAPERLADPAFLRASAQLAATSLGIGAASLLATASALLLLKEKRYLSPALMVLAILELLLFAHHATTTFNVNDVVPKEIAELSAKSEYRLLNQLNANTGMLTGGEDIWGYDALSLTRRYGEYIAVSQGQSPAAADPYQQFTQYSPLLGLLRCRYLIQPQDGTSANLQEVPLPVPRLALVPGYKPVTGRDAVLQALTEENFDPLSDVILETPPDPAPAGGSGSVRLLSENTDELVIEAETNYPAILLITDNYSRDWTARALPGSSQQTYHLQPADYTLRAVPLAAGKHRLKLEYVPRGFVTGVWISVISLLLYVGAALFLTLRRRASQIP